MTRLAELRRAADCCRDVVAHAREGIAAAGPGFILVVAGDEVGADVADGELGWLTRRAVKETPQEGPRSVKRGL